MADLSAGKKPVDARQAKIRLRRMEHEINSMKNSVDKFEIDILEAEQNIIRIGESIEATGARIADKQAELDEQVTAAKEK